MKNRGFFYLIKIIIYIIGTFGIIETICAHSDPISEEQIYENFEQHHPFNSDLKDHLIPMRLYSGDTVGLVSSASRASDAQIETSKKRLMDLGLKVREGKTIHNVYYDLAGTEAERAQDLNEMFNDPEVKAIFEIRGGWSSKKVLPLLDYQVIRNNPKIIIGFSDITCLLLAIYNQTGLITFHGPLTGTTGSMNWTNFTINSLNKVLFSGEKIVFTNLPDKTPRTITPGIAQGKLIGGNLTLLTRMLHSKYLPDFNGAILFLEDIGEPSRKVEGMLEELKDAGILQKISGFVFGKCTDCDQPSSEAKTVDDILNEYIKPLGIPAWSNAMIGHVGSMWTLPVGSYVEINADQGTITMLEKAVK